MTVIMHSSIAENLYFCTHSEIIESVTYWSGFSSFGSLIVSDPEDEHFGEHRFWISPDEIVEFQVFTTPGAAWWLYNPIDETWTERPYPDGWDGLVAGGNDA